MKFKNKLFHLSVFTASALMFSGCFDNPLGVGYEHSACESSSKFGVCGSPKDIYQNRDKIRIVQQDYIKSGIEDEVFFGIGRDGDMLIKSERGEQWERYEKSEYKKRVDQILKDRSKEELSSKTTNSQNEKAPKVNYSISDIPVTEGNDLSIQYKAQGSLIETRTNVGNMIRDYGLIQKIWVAPISDNKGDLISAHDILLVVKDPKWIIGEATPKNVNSDKVSTLPTPISRSVLETLDKTTKNEADILKNFNAGNEGGLIQEINNNPFINSEEYKKNMNQIQNFIKE